MLRLDGITKRFDGREVLAATTINLGAGDHLAVRGPNGSGKTTLLRIAAGVLRPTSGSVDADGPLAYVAQAAPLYEALTAPEHWRWWTRLHGQAGSRADAAVALRAAGVPDQTVGTLSRGQRQRLALTMAFDQRPALLLLDEPDAALDDAGRSWLHERLAATDAAVMAALHGPVPGFTETLELGG